MNVGIVWAGNPEHEQSHHRDIPLAYWLRLSEIPGVTLHSFQVGERSKDIIDLGAYGLIQDRAPEISNYLDTAYLVASMDLMITVDTSVAHLAGAMGRPIWMLVNQRGQDFRWGDVCDKTGWYKSMTIFRRGLHEQWTDVMALVAMNLGEFACD